MNPWNPVMDSKREFVSSESDFVSASVRGVITFLLYTWFVVALLLVGSECPAGLVKNYQYSLRFFSTDNWQYSVLIYTEMQFEWWKNCTVHSDSGRYFGIFFTDICPVDKWSFKGKKWKEMYQWPHLSHCSSGWHLVWSVEPELPVWPLPLAAAASWQVVG